MISIQLPADHEFTLKIPKILSDIFNQLKIMCGPQNHIRIH